MAVSTIVTPKILPLNPGSDKRFPQVLYFARGDATGDASGSTLAVIIRWPDALPNFIFSFETLTIHYQKAGITGNIVSQSLLQTEMTTQVAGNTFNFYLDVSAPTNDPGGDAMVHKILGTPLWIPDSGTAWQLANYVANGAGITLTATGWGYAWDLDAYKLSGGPVKPGAFSPLTIPL